MRYKEAFQVFHLLLVPGIQPSMELTTEDAPPTPRIPRAAFITSLAAVSPALPRDNKSSSVVFNPQLAFTTGLTVAIIPSLRRSRTRKAGFQFLSNTSLARGAAGTVGARRIPRPTTTGSSVTTVPPAPPPPTAALGLRVRSAPLQILDDPHPSLAPVHPADEVSEDVGPGDGGISPLFALGAFSIATGIVLVTAGATAWAVARVLDVRDVSRLSLFDWLLVEG